MENREILVDNARRRVLRLGIGALCLGAAPPVQAALAMPEKPRSLSFQHLHTGERASVVYWEDGGYVPGALSEIDTLLRDFRTGESTNMDRALYDQLFALRRLLDTRAAFQVISGYRSPKTNAALARNSKGVAHRSLHQYGQAIDIRISGIRLNDMRKAARSLRLGGVGYYPRSNFIHVDTGRVRYW